MHNYQVIDIPVTANTTGKADFELLTDFDKVVGACVMPKVADVGALKELINTSLISAKHDGDAKFIKEGTPLALLYYSEDVANDQRFHKFFQPYEGGKKRIAVEIKNNTSSDAVISFVVIYG